MSLQLEVRAPKTITDLLKDTNFSIEPHEGIYHVLTHKNGGQVRIVIDYDKIIELTMFQLKDMEKEKVELIRQLAVYHKYKFMIYEPQLTRTDKDWEEYTQSIINLQKQNITFDKFLALDIRICEIISAERVPKKDRLLKLVINTGFDERVAVTNIGDQFSPETLIGMKTPFILNLEPTTIAGIESKAMIIAASTEEKQAILFAPTFTAIFEVKPGNIVI